MNRQNERLISLIPAIQKLATAHVASYPGNLDADDVFQEAALCFLKRAQDDPTFLDQSDEEIARQVVRDGWNAARRRWKSWQDGRQLPLESLTFTLPVSAPDPEEEAVKIDLAERIRERTAKLKPNYQIVAWGLMNGIAKGKIMEAMGVKPQCFTWYRKRLAHAFASMALL